MAQATIVGGRWDFDVERGPDWLFVRPRRLSGGDSSAAGLAELIWSMLEQQFTHRLVLEMCEVEQFDSELAGQLVWLHEQIRTHDGLMRVCGMTSEQADVFHACQLGGHFPSYETREDAVMGHACSRQLR